MISTRRQLRRSDTEHFTVLAAQVTGAHGVDRQRPPAADRRPGRRDGALSSNRQPCACRRRRTTPGRPLTLVSLRRMPGPKGGWIGHFKEVKDRTEAETLDRPFAVHPRNGTAALPEGEYYVDHLLGLDVVTDTGHDLGTLTDVMNTPANDVYVTDQDVLIPAVAEFILSDRPGRPSRSSCATCRACGKGPDAIQWLSTSSRSSRR